MVAEHAGIRKNIFEDGTTGRMGRLSRLGNDVTIVCPTCFPKMPCNTLDTRGLQHCVLYDTQSEDMISAIACNMTLAHCIGSDLSQPASPMRQISLRHVLIPFQLRYI